jgi:hypothetical protein
VHFSSPGWSERDLTHRRKSLGIVDFFIIRQAVVDRLPQQVYQMQLRVLSSPTIRNVLGNE